MASLSWLARSGAVLLAVAPTGAVALAWATVASPRPKTPGRRSSDTSDASDASDTVWRLLISGVSFQFVERRIVVTACHTLDVKTRKNWTASERRRMRALEHTSLASDVPSYPTTYLALPG